MARRRAVVENPARNSGAVPRKESRARTTDSQTSDARSSPPSGATTRSHRSKDGFAQRQSAAKERSSPPDALVRASSNESGPAHASTGSPIAAGTAAHTPARRRG